MDGRRRVRASKYLAYHLRHRPERIGLRLDGRGWADVDTLFVTVVCWRQLAENVAASCAKGDPVMVSGRLRIRQWSADDGRQGTACKETHRTHRPDPPGRIDHIGSIARPPLR